MKKILFVLFMCVVSLLVNAENQDTLKYYTSIFTYSSYYYRFELLSNGDIIQTKESYVKDCVKYGVRCNKTTRKLNIFSVNENGFLWGYSDSIVIMLKADKEFTKKLKNQYGIKCLSPKKIKTIMESDLIKKITELYIEGSQKINNRICIIYDSLGIYAQNNKMIIKKNNEDEFFIEYNSHCYTNSVGGTSPNVSILNCSKKTIKYFYFTCKYYNRVNDLIADKISGETEIQYGIVGPIGYLNNGTTAIFDDNFYNSTADHYEVCTITLEYMDGSSKTFNKNQIDAHKVLSFDDVKYNIYDDDINRLWNEFSNIRSNHNKHFGNVVNYTNYNPKYNDCCEEVTCSITKQAKEILGIM